jgi:hypothetical protein
MHRSLALRSALIVAVATAALPLDTTAFRAPVPGWVLEPGRALGPVVLGMSRAELRRLGPLSPHPSGSFGSTVMVSQAWTYYFPDASGRLRTARRPLALTPGVVLNGRRIAPASTLTDIARLRLPGCSSIQRRLGGDVITCRSRWGYAHFTEGATTRGRVEVDISKDP